MTVSDAMLGYDTLYEIWDASIATPAFVPVAEVFAFTPGATSADRVEVTHFKSPGRRREYIAGMIDSGEASFELNFIPNNPSDILIRGLLSSGDVVEHRVTFPNGVTVTFDAAITGYERGVPVDDRMTGTVTLAVSGDETWAAAA